MITRAALLGAFLIVAACGGGTTATPARPTGAAPTGLPQATGAAPTPAPTTLGPAPAPGSGTVSVTLTGGADAGTYTGSENPNCTDGIVGADVWGVQYSILAAPANQLSSLQFVYRPEGVDDEGQMLSGVSLLTTATIGPFEGTGARSYEIEMRTDGDESSGEGTVEITESGATAVIHVVGTTGDGVGIDATINCPTVIRP